MDSYSLLSIGLSAQSNISLLSDCILHYYKTNINESAEKIASEIIAIIDQSDSSETCVSRVEELQNNLLEIRIRLTMDNVMFEQFINLNESYRQKVQEASDTISDFLGSSASDEIDSYDQSALHKRIEDLKLTTMVSLQMDQQLSLLISNNRTSISSIEKTVFTTITLWKNRLFIENQQKQA